MQDVINLLLAKQATIDEDCENAKQAAVEKIECEFAERKERIADLLEMAGYVPPVVEELGEQGEEQATDADATENVTAAYGTQTIL